MKTKNTFSIKTLSPNAQETLLKTLSYESPKWLMGVFGLGLIAFVIVPAVLLGIYSTYPPLGFLFALPFTAIWFQLYRPIEKRAQYSLLSREEEWLQSFPFPVSGYFEALSSPCEKPFSYLIKISINFKKHGPTVKDIQNLVQSTTEEVITKVEENIIMLQSKPLSTDHTTDPKGNTTSYSNYKGQQWLRSMIDNVCQPIQERHPITKIEIITK